MAEDINNTVIGIKLDTSGISTGYKTLETDTSAALGNLKGELARIQGMNMGSTATRAAFTQAAATTAGSVEATGRRAGYSATQMKDIDVRGQAKQVVSQFMEHQGVAPNVRGVTSNFGKMASDMGVAEDQMVGTFDRMSGKLRGFASTTKRFDFDEITAKFNGFFDELGSAVNNRQLTPAGGRRLLNQAQMVHPKAFNLGEERKVSELFARMMRDEPSMETLMQGDIAARGGYNLRHKFAGSSPGSLAYTDAQRESAGLDPTFKMYGEGQAGRKAYLVQSSLVEEAETQKRLLTTRLASEKTTLEMYRDQNKVMEGQVRLKDPGAMDAAGRKQSIDRQIALSSGLRAERDFQGTPGAIDSSAALKTARTETAALEQLAQIADEDYLGATVSLAEARQLAKTNTLEVLAYEDEYLLATKQAAAARHRIANHGKLGKAEAELDSPEFYANAKAQARMAAAAVDNVSQAKLTGDTGYIKDKAGIATSLAEQKASVDAELAESKPYRAAKVASTKSVTALNASNVQTLAADKSYQANRAALAKSQGFTATSSMMGKTAYLNENAGVRSKVLADNVLAQKMINVETKKRLNSTTVNAQTEASLTTLKLEEAALMKGIVTSTGLKARQGVANARIGISNQGLQDETAIQRARLMGAGPPSVMQRFSQGVNQVSTGEKRPAHAFNRFGKTFSSTFTRTLGYGISGFALYGTISAMRGIFDESKEMQRELLLLQQQFEFAEDATASLGSTMGGSFKQLAEDVQDISTETAIAPSRVTHALRRFAGAAGEGGQPDFETGKSDTLAAGKFADILNIDFKDVTNELVAIRSSYGSMGANVELISDDILHFAQKYGSDPKEIMNFSSAIAPMAKQIGFTQQQIEGIGGLVNRVSGVPGSQLADSMMGVFEKLGQDPAQFLQIVSGNPDTAGRSAGFADALAKQDMSQLLREMASLYMDGSGLTLEQKASITSMAGSRREQPALQALTADPAELFKILDGGHVDTSGVAQKFFDKYTESVEYNFAKLSQFANRIGKELLDSGLSEVLNNLTRHLAQAAKVVQGFVGALAKVNDFTGGMVGDAATGLALGGAAVGVKKLSDKRYSIPVTNAFGEEVQMTGAPAKKYIKANKQALQDANQMGIAYQWDLGHAQIGDVAQIQGLQVQQDVLRQQARAMGMVKETEAWTTAIETNSLKNIEMLAVQEGYVATATTEAKVAALQQEQVARVNVIRTNAIKNQEAYRIAQANAGANAPPGHNVQTLGVEGVPQPEAVPVGWGARQVAKSSVIQGYRKGGVVGGLKGVGAMAMNPAVMLAGYVGYSKVSHAFDDYNKETDQALDSIQEEMVDAFNRGLSKEQILAKAKEGGAADKENIGRRAIKWVSRTDTDYEAIKKRLDAAAGETEDTWMRSALDGLTEEQLAAFEGQKFQFGAEDYDKWDFGDKKVDEYDKGAPKWALTGADVLKQIADGGKTDQVKEALRNMEGGDAIAEAFDLVAGANAADQEIRDEVEKLANSTTYDEVRVKYNIRASSADDLLNAGRERIADIQDIIDKYLDNNSQDFEALEALYGEQEEIRAAAVEALQTKHMGRVLDAKIGAIESTGGDEKDVYDARLEAALHLLEDPVTNQQDRYDAAVEVFEAQQAASDALEIDIDTNIEVMRAYIGGQLGDDVLKQMAEDLGVTEMELVNQITDNVANNVNTIIDFDAEVKNATAIKQLKAAIAGYESELEGVVNYDDDPIHWSTEKSRRKAKLDEMLEERKKWLTEEEGKAFGFKQIQKLVGLSGSTKPGGPGEDDKKEKADDLAKRMAMARVDLAKAYAEDDPMALAHLAMEEANIAMRYAEKGSPDEVMAAAQQVRAANQIRKAALDQQKTMAKNSLEIAKVWARDPVDQANIGVQLAQADVAFAADPAARAQAMIGYNQALRVQQDAYRDQAKSIAKSHVEIAKIWADGDPVAMANEDMRSANVDMSFATTKEEIQQAKVAQEQAKKSQRDAAREVVQARLQYMQTISSGDSVQEAKYAIQSAQHAVSIAKKGTPAWYQAKGQLKQAQDQFRSALMEISIQREEFAGAISSLYNDGVAEAEHSLNAAKLALTEGRQNGMRGARLNELKQQVSEAQIKLGQAVTDEQLDTINFLYDMGEQTASQTIAALQNVLSQIPERNVQLRRQIQQQIHNLRESLAGDLNFNIPSDVKLPTLYEARRLNQTPSGSSYQDNRVITFEINDASDPVATAQQVADIINRPPTSGSYVPVGSR